MQTHTHENPNSAQKTGVSALAGPSGIIKIEEKEELEDSSHKEKEDTMCPNCGENFRDKYALQIHCMDNHSRKNEEVAEEVEEVAEEVEEVLIIKEEIEDEPEFVSFEENIAGSNRKRILYLG